MMTMMAVVMQVMLKKAGGNLLQVAWLVWRQVLATVEQSIRGWGFNSGWERDLQAEGNSFC